MKIMENKNVEVLEGETSESLATSDVSNIENNVELKNSSNIIAKNKEKVNFDLEDDVYNLTKLKNLNDLIWDLKFNTKFIDHILFFDNDENKLCRVTNEKDETRTIKLYDKTSTKLFVKSLIENYIEDNIIDESVEKESKYLEKIIGNIKSYEKIYDRHKEEFFRINGINYFNFFKITPLLKYESNLKSRSYEEIYNILIKDFPRLFLLLKNNFINDEGIKFFLNWTTMEIFEPREIETTFILIGEQGSGKSLIAEDFFKRNIYHTLNVPILNNSSLKDKFNEIFEGKSFLIMNEISTMEMKENNQITQEIKNLITGKDYVSRGMFKSGKENVKTFNMCFLSNKNAPLQIENNDRRFNVFGRSIPLKENIDVINFIKKENNIENFKDDETFKLLFKNFILKTKEEITNFLYILKELDYDSSYGKNSIMTNLKEEIIRSTNTKDDLFRSYFNTNQFEKIIELLEKNDFYKNEKWMPNFKKMIEHGIFLNTYLLEIYCNIYNITLTDFNKKEIETKSGAFFNKNLKSGKDGISFNNNFYRYKIINEDDIEFKKDILKGILKDDLNKEIEVVYETIKKDDEILKFKEFIEDKIENENLEISKEF